MPDSTPEDANPPPAIDLHEIRAIVKQSNCLTCTAQVLELGGGAPKQLGRRRVRLTPVSYPGNKRGAIARLASQAQAVPSKGGGRLLLQPAAPSEGYWINALGSVIRVDLELGGEDAANAR